MASDWYYLKDGETIGPVTSGDLKRMARSGELQPDDLVTKGGAAKWARADKIRGLFGDKPRAGDEPDDGDNASDAAAPSSAPATEAAPEPRATVRPITPRPRPATGQPKYYDDPAEALAALAAGEHVGPPPDEATASPAFDINAPDDEPA